MISSYFILRFLRFLYALNSLIIYDSPMCCKEWGRATGHRNDSSMKSHQMACCILFIFYFIYLSIYSFLHAFSLICAAVITVLSHGHHGTSNHRPIDSFFNNWLRLTGGISKLCITCPFSRRIQKRPNDGWIALTIGHYYGHEIRYLLVFLPTNFNSDQWHYSVTS